ncbi:MAG: hypothetical protein H7832_02425 [Magnetococcus sp. DMHC-6]
MTPDQLCQKMGAWFQKHKDEEPFAFGEIHLSTDEPDADILLIIGKPEQACADEEAYEKQWENTIYDAPVTWLWHKLAQNEADEWLKIIYGNEFPSKKIEMLKALLELATLIESNGYEIEWDLDDDQEMQTVIPINKIAKKISTQTDRWKQLLTQ